LRPNEGKALTHFVCLRRATGLPVNDVKELAQGQRTQAGMAFGGLALALLMPLPGAALAQSNIVGPRTITQSCIAYVVAYVHERVPNSQLDAFASEEEFIRLYKTEQEQFLFDKCVQF
jgi:hypothetical protein